MSARIITTVRQMTDAVMALRREGKTVGFVPTLGALHDGHLSLIKRAVKDNDAVVVSVFVNPPQFRKAYYKKYPRDLEGDVAKASLAGADIVFAPSVEEIYPNGYSAEVRLPAMFRVLRSQKIEWHYKAVLTVVLKLFNIVAPTRAYFGLKDPHQLALIERMVLDLNLPVKVVPCPTVRERSGLARSSRNELLTEEEEKVAPVIYKALTAGKKELLRSRKTSAALRVIRATLKCENKAVKVKPEHIEIVDAKTLLPLGVNSTEALIYTAVWIGDKRLADNVRFKLPKA